MSTASLVETLNRFLHGKPSWLGSAAELIEALRDEMGVVIDDPRCPWVFGLEVLSVNSALVARGLVVETRYRKPQEILFIYRPGRDA